MTTMENGEGRKCTLPNRAEEKRLSRHGHGAEGGWAV